MNWLAILRIHELGATDGTERADAGADPIRLFHSGPQRAGLHTHCRFRHHALTGQLPWQRPISHESGNPLVQPSAETFHIQLLPVALFFGNAAPPRRFP
jgi:hypothetical protein